MINVQHLSFQYIIETIILIQCPKNELLEKKQTAITASTTKVEFVKCFKTTIQANWLQNFILGLGLVESFSMTLKIYCDNSVAVLFSKKKGI